MVGGESGFGAWSLVLIRGRGTEDKMAKITVLMTTSLIETFLRKFANINHCFVREGLPEDAKLVSASLVDDIALYLLFDSPSTETDITQTIVLEPVIPIEPGENEDDDIPF